MADLGNMYFNIMFRDKTDEEIAKIRAKVERDLKTKLNIGFDKKALFDNVSAALGERQFKIGVIVDKAEASAAVRDAMQKAGLGVNTSASDVRNAKITNMLRESEQRLRDMRQKSADIAKRSDAQLEIMRQRVIAATARAQKAEDGLTAARQRANNAQQKNSSLLAQSGQQLKSHNSLLAQAKSMAGLYFSLYGAQRFLRSLVDIRGEFELQLISLKAILQDGDKAVKLFEQIKGLAVVSPFEVKDLVSYAKQLSAFQIPYNELFDTTKRLADLSAGLGVDMSRIILAYGQVRSAAFLRGQEVRQFTEAGIPLLGALADKFSELEGRVVSAGEVFDKISRREVPFQMVKDVLFELTSEGGKFYNMQEKQAQSVKAMYKNLKDAYQIMVNSIGEANDGVIKGFASGLMDVMKNWEVYLDVLKIAIAMYGAYRVSVMAATIIQKGFTEAVKTSAIATRLLNTALVKNPFTLVLSAIVAVIGGLIAYSAELKRNEKALLENIGAINKQKDKVNEYIDELKDLTKTESKSDESTKKRIKILNELNDIEPQLAKAVKEHADNLEELTKIQDKYNKMMDARRFAEYVVAESGKGWFNDSITENFKDLTDAKNRADKYAASLDVVGIKIRETLEQIHNQGGVKTPFGLFEFSPDEGYKIQKILSETKDNAEVVQKMFQLLAPKKGRSYAGGEFYGMIFDEKARANNAEYIVSLKKLESANKDYAKSVEYVANLVGSKLKRDDVDPKLEENADHVRSVINELPGLQGEFVIQKDILLKLGVKIEGEAEKEDLDKDLSDWQKQIKQMLGKSSPIEINAQTNIEEIYSGIKDTLPKIQGVIKEQAKTLKGYGFDFDKLAFVSPVNVDPIIDTVAKSYISNKAAESALKRGLGFLDIELEKKEKGKDPFTENLKKQLDTIKAAYAEYEKLIKIMSREDALSKIGESVGFSGVNTDYLQEGGLMKAYEDYLKKIKGRSTEAAKDTARTWQQEYDKLNFGEISKKFEKEIRDSEKHISYFVGKYKSYKDILEKTGDEELAVRLSFGDDFDGSPDLVSYLSNQIKELSSKRFNIDLDFDAGNPYKRVREQLGEELYSKLPKDIQQAIDELDNYVQESFNRETEIYIESLSKFNDYYVQKERIIREYTRKIDIATKNGNTALANSLTSEMNFEIEKIGANYTKFYSAILSLTKAEARDIGNNLKSGLVDMMQKGAISAKEYYEWLDKINDQLKKSEGRKSFFNELSSGGVDGLLSSINDIGGQKVQAGTVDYNKALSDRNKFFKEGNLQSAQMAGDTMTAAQGTMKMGEGMQNFASKAQGAMQMADMIVQAIDQGVKATQQLVDAFAELAESRGIDTESGTWGKVRDNMALVSNINKYGKASWDSLKSGDGVGVIANAVQMVTSTFALANKQHDAKLQKQIEASEKRLKALQDITAIVERRIDRHLGNAANMRFDEADKDVERFKEIDSELASINARMDKIKNKDDLDFGDLAALHKLSKTQKKLTEEYDKYQKRVEAYKTGGAYGYQRQLLEEQLGELEKQRKAENDKKDKDKDKLADYDARIAEMRDKVKYFMEDLAESLYGIDLKGWASQLGDALYEAWKKGEDGAKAFEATVSDIMGSVVNEMLKMLILEPAMKELRNMMFGSDGKGGFMTDSTIDDKEAKEIGNYLMSISGQAGEFTDMLNKIFDGTDYDPRKQNGADSGLKSSISGISEQTGDLLLSYMNAIRADVSIKRDYVRRVVEELLPYNNRIADAQLQQLTMIQKNTANNAASASEIRDMLNSVINGGKRIKTTG